MSMCFVLELALTFSDMKMAPTLSTHTTIGNLSGIPMVSRICATNLIFFAASLSAKYSASELDRETERCPFDFQRIGTASRKKMNYVLLILVSLSPALLIYNN